MTYLVPPVDYGTIMSLLRRAHPVLTDAGGIHVLARPDAPLAARFGGIDLYRVGPL